MQAPRPLESAHKPSAQANEATVARGLLHSSKLGTLAVDSKEITFARAFEKLCEQHDVQAACAHVSSTSELAVHGDPDVARFLLLAIAVVNGDEQPNISTVLLNSVN